MTFSQTGIKFIPIRHATAIIEINNKKILIDPMLSEKESLPPVILTANKLKNPRTDLPFSLDTIIERIDYLLVTHLHFDHFDKKAMEILSKKIPVISSKTDGKRLSNKGFKSIPVSDKYEVDGIIITRFPAVHGKGLLKYLMGKGSSYLLNYKGFKIFLTGDCLLTNSLKNNLIETAPDIVIVNAGAAKFRFGKSITMSITEVKEISGMLPKSKIITVHLDALNHCTETSEYSKSQILDYPNIYIPSNGEIIEIK